MKSLLLKDILTLRKSLFLLVFLMLFFAMATGTIAAIAYGIVFSSLLPITAMSYDERSGWNKMALMMPLSRNAIVGSKYLLGTLFLVATTLLFLLGIAIRTLIPVLAYTDDISSAAAIGGIFAGLGFGHLLMAIFLPVNFRFGSEKGRIISMVLIFACSLLLILTITMSSENSLLFRIVEWFYETDKLNLIIPGFDAVCILLFLASIPLSAKLYRQGIERQ